MSKAPSEKESVDLSLIYDNVAQVQLRCFGKADNTVWEVNQSTYDYGNFEVLMNWKYIPQTRPNIAMEHKEEIDKFLHRLLGKATN